MTDEEYQEAYRAGYEDGKALGDVWFSGPFVVMYIDRKDSDMYRTSWRNIDSIAQGELLMIGLEDVVDDLEESIEELTDKDDDDE